MLEFQPYNWTLPKELSISIMTSADVMLYAYSGTPYDVALESGMTVMATIDELDPWYHIDPKTHLPIF